MSDQETKVTTNPHQPSDLLSGKALFRIGLVLLLGAVAFFLRYSFEQGWIGPTTQMAMAAGTGMAMIVVGTQIVERRPAYGTLLQGGGGAVLYLTAFAAHLRLDILDTTEAFVLLAAVSAGVVGLALRYRSEALAVAGFGGALAAPFTIGGRIETFPGDAGYLAVVLIAAATLYLMREWAWAFGVTVAGVAAYLVVDVAGSWLFETGNAGETVFGLAALWVVGWGASVVAAARRPAALVSSSIVPVAVTSAIPIGAYLGTVAVAGSDLGTGGRMSIALAMAAVHVVVFAAMRHTRVPRLTVSIQLVPASVLAALAWVDALEGTALLMLLAIQSATMIVLGIRSHLDELAYVGHFFAMLVGVSWVVVISENADAVFDGSDLFGAMVVVIAVVVALVTRNEEEPHGTLARAYGSLALPAALTWSATSLSGLEQGSGLVTGAWAAIGIGTIVGGRLTGISLVRNAGIAVTLLAVAKLLLIDMSSAAPLTRISLFAGIGLGLLAVGYWLGGADEEEQDEQATEPEQTGRPATL